MMLMSGPLLWLIYKGIVTQWPSLALGLFPAQTSIATMIAGAATTMLGILAGIITVLFAITSSEVFQRYRRKGYLNALFAVYRWTIVLLAATGLMSLTAFAHQPSQWVFHLLIVLFIDDVVMVAAIAWIIVTLSHNAHSKNEQSNS